MMAIELTPASDATEESTERWKSTEGSAHVTTRGSGKPQITPTMGGSKTSSITPIATTYTKNIKLLATINTQDDVEAGTKLTNEYDNVLSILPNEIVDIESPSAAITRVSVIALITGATPGAGAKLASSTEATVATNLRTFVFNSSDNVRLVNIGLVDNGTPADTNMFCEGFKYE